MLLLFAGLPPSPLPAKGVAGPAGNWYQFKEQPRHPRHAAVGLSTPTAGAAGAPDDQSHSISTPQHRSRAPGRAHPSGTRLLKPALNEVQGRRHARKIFVQRGTAAFGEDAHACSGGCAAHTAVLRDSSCGAVGLFIPFPRRRSRLLSISVMPLEKSEEIHHSP